MARDRKKNAYFVVGIPYESVVYQALVDESKNTGVSISKLIAVKLYEQYAGQSSFRVSPGRNDSDSKLDEAEANALAFLESEE